MGNLIYFRHSLLVCHLYNQGLQSCFALPLRMITVTSNKREYLCPEAVATFLFCPQLCARITSTLTRGHYRVNMKWRYNNQCTYKLLYVISYVALQCTPKFNDYDNIKAWLPFVMQLNTPRYSPSVFFVCLAKNDHRNFLLLPTVGGFLGTWRHT